jgi:hypothetical protein
MCLTFSSGFYSIPKMIREEVSSRDGSSMVEQYPFKVLVLGSSPNRPILCGK